jgi:predicted AAA+ superfamily ATPase
MAHDRSRYAQELFEKLIKFSPIVGVFGHRQVGKSTFISKNISNYQTLDDVDTLMRANLDPKKFIQIKKNGSLAIDECQLEPKLFPTLKEWVRTNKQPCQFILSGSVRFTSRKAIRESLAGRLAFLEMLPFSVTEIAKLPLSFSIPQLLQYREFSQDSLRALNFFKNSELIKKHFDTYLESGGLPGLCFIRESKLKRQSLNDLHDLILTRDLMLVANIATSLSTLKKWMSEVARLGFTPYNASEIRRKLGLSPETQKRIIFGLESIFLIRRIPVPERKKEIILLEDQYEEYIYAGQTQDRIQCLESAVYRNIRTQFMYRLQKGVTIESYLTRDYARVPIVIRDDLEALGIIVTLGEKPSLSEVRSGSSFLRKFSRGKILYLSQEPIVPKVLDARSILASIYHIL